MKAEMTPHDLRKRLEIKTIRCLIWTETGIRLWLLML